MFVFDTIFRPVIKIFHSASQATVDTKLIADIGCSATPKIYIVKTLIHQYFSVTDTGNPYTKGTVVCIVHFSFHLYPFIFKLFKRNIVDKDSFSTCSCITCVNDLHSSVSAVRIATWCDGDKRCTVIALLSFELVDMAE